MEIFEKDDFQRLKEEIAIKHGISLSDNDPILMFVTLNDYLLKQYEKALEDRLSQLDDIVFNTKTDINNYIKENEIALFKRIQEINNKSVEAVNTQIKTYFNQEAEAYKKLNNRVNSNNSFLKMSILINIVMSAIIIIMIVVK